MEAVALDLRSDSDLYLHESLTDALMEVVVVAVAVAVAFNAIDEETNRLDSIRSQIFLLDFVFKSPETFFSASSLD